MSISRRLLLGAAAGAVALPRPGRSQSAMPLRIGVMNDQSGPYRDDGGPTGVICTRQAVQEMAATLGFEVEVLSADHQNKPDIGAGIARQWFDQGGVDADGGCADLVGCTRRQHACAARRTRSC